jgi:hypothetical protein
MGIGLESHRAAATPLPIRALECPKQKIPMALSMCSAIDPTNQSLRANAGARRPVTLHRPFAAMIGQEL